MELIKCSEFMVNVLGYTKCSQANWFRQMIQDQDQEHIKEIEGKRYFTTKGLNRAIQLCKRPPKNFQRLQEICDANNLEMPAIKQIKKNCNHIYVIHCDDLPFIKCGQTNNITRRMRQYKCSHWDVIVKRAYLIDDSQNLNEVEQKCFKLFVENGFEKKSEKFRTKKIQELDSVLEKLDIMISQLQ